ncbi:hypothetical protein [Streptomyces microflavus]|uniref:hypothetical protein n=1 Tax=Streptomyces microflavus TaxID=1919 RepID=UPI003B221AEF
MIPACPPPSHHAPGRTSRAPGLPALTRYAPMLEALWRRERLLVDAYGLSTAQLDGPRDLAASTASGWCRAARTGARPQR